MASLFRNPLGAEGRAALAFISAAIGEFPLVPVRLKPGEKIPAERFAISKARRERMGTSALIATVRVWLCDGANIGLILHHAGIWVLDLDILEGLPLHIQGVIDLLLPPEVRTPSGGRHCYFSLPDDLATHPNLKAHVNLRRVPGLSLAADLKLGGRQTLVVAPGSRRPGGEYQIIRPWDDPPLLDPRELFPTASLLHAEQSLTEPAEFLTDDRSFKDRAIRGMHYLARARPSISGQGGRRALANVCAHLCGFLRLPKKEALALLTQPPGRSWNDKCVDGASGKPYPWALDELERALDEGKARPPRYGVVLAQQLHRRREMEEKLELACRIVRKHMPRGRVLAPVREVYAMVLHVTGMSEEDCTPVRFGLALRRAGVIPQRKGSHRRRSIRIQQGLTYLEARLGEAFGAAERDSIASS